MITALAITIRLTILRMNLSRSTFCSVETSLSNRRASRFMTSVLVKQNPSREREDDHQTRINERRRTDVRFQVSLLDDPMGDKCQRQPAQNADHPRWEVRAENVHRR